MKTSKIAIIFCLLLVTSSVLPLVFADVPLANRFDDTGNYGIVAAGVGLEGESSGSININVPGTVEVAYLYWAGIGLETGGDDTVKFADNELTADHSLIEEWGVISQYSFVYIEDVTTLVSSGDNLYSIEEVNIARNYGAGLVVVYEDPSLPTTRIVLMDGADGFWFDWYPDLGPNSDVACFEFAAGTCDRNADMFLFSGGTEHEDRPNEVWTETGTGTPESDIIDPPSSPTDPPDYPLRAADGPSWDTYTADVLIPAGDEWLCVQIESIESYEDEGAPNFEGRGTSALFIAAGLVLPIPCDDFEGLTPGFWKNHVSCWDEDYTEGLFFADVFNLNEPITIDAGKKSENANPTLLEALKAKGGVNEEEGIYDALLRHAVAALLNAAHDFVNYPMTEDAIKGAVKLAIENDDMYDAEQLKNELESFNKLGGGIDAHGNPI